MSMMSKLCSDLRSAADEGYCPNRDRILMRNAADTIECLSEKVRSQNLHPCEKASCSEKANNSSKLIRIQDAIDAFTTDGTRMERLGLRVLSVADAKQKAVDLLHSLPSVEMSDGYTEWLEERLLDCEPDILCDVVSNECNEWCEDNCKGMRQECLKKCYELCKAEVER